MKVIISNRLENLAEKLAGQLKKPLSRTLTPETIVVQSAGMAKWISLQLALRHGVAANYRFPFPNAFVEEVFSAFIPEYAKNSLFDEGVLAWRIMELLPQMRGFDAFSAIRKYLDDESDQRRLYQLAGKIARTFDQYLIFRPDMVLRWEKEGAGGEDEQWQAALWRKILETQGRLHKASLRQRLIEAMQNKPCRPEALPERVSVFGISYLPPYHLDILVRLSAYMPVHYYYLNPSREFWADIRSEKEINRVVRKMTAGRPELNDLLLHLETGNSLLAAWGAQGRDFFRLMEDMSVEYEDLFEDNRRETLLDKVQDDIHRLCEPLGEKGEKEKADKNDGSIQIHACHSPLREVETLHDNLLSLFDKDKSLKPEDVLVMTPDIETYAPCIEAVFESREPKIPYSIADRRALSENPIAGGLMSLLDMAESRFKTGEVLALLDNPAIREKFGILPEGRELIDFWVGRTLIKWGIDEEHRRSFDLPSFPQNTWKHGLDRLLAGFVFDGRHPEIYDGILPYGDIESDQTEVLGLFLMFWEKLVDLKKTLGKRHTPAQWCEILNGILQDYFPVSDEYRNERYLIHQIIGGLLNEQAQAGCTMPVDLSVILSYFKEAFARTGGSAIFLQGGVSFCAMLPMRSIPFPVICLMGMNADAYPRRDAKTGFNVMENERRAGDRLLRNDDQYLFLESVLSARKSLIVSYAGLSQTDNSEMPPSVLVNDFLDYLDRNYSFENSRNVSEVISRIHRLHAFSPAYFGAEEKLFSYSESNYLSACAVAGGRKEKKRFLKDPLDEPANRDEIITLQNLMRFYADPVRYFLEYRLGLKLPVNLASEEQDSEPFRIDALSAYRIKTDLIENRLNSGDDRSVYEQKRAEGALPVGAAGDHLFNDIRSGAAAFAENVADCLNGPALEKLFVDLSLEDGRITGVLDRFQNDYRLVYRPAKLKMKDYLNAWIAHVILNAASPEDYPKTGLLLGEDGCMRFEPISNAGEILKNLIRYYRLGHTKPVKLFARSSWAYASALWQKNKTEKEALDAARAAWEGDESGWTPADSKETACRICFEGLNPIDDEFQKTAEDILRDLFAGMKKEEA